MKIICKSYTLGNLTYQLTNSGFIKMLAFHIIGSCLWYTIPKSMVYAPFIIMTLDETFPIVSEVTQIEIISRSYTRRNFTFHLLGSYLGNIVAKGMVEALLTIFLLYGTFPMVS